MTDIKDNFQSARPAKATINDIARVCGVSKVTVSYVLNDTGKYVKISEATKARVRQAAADMQYHPNALAKGLAKNKTNLLALVMQYADVFTGGSAFISELMHNAILSASEQGYDLMLQTKRRDLAQDQIAGIADGRADGALLLRDSGDPITIELQRRGFPCVCIFTHSEDPQIASVDCDNLLGGQLAADYLLKLGHRSIGYIGGPLLSPAVTDRLDGFRMALAEAGIQLRPDWEFAATYPGSDFSHFEMIMRQPDRPTALFCWSDDVAGAAMNVIQAKLGLRIPEDVSIVGFDSTPLCEHTTPRLTSIRQPFKEITDAAFQTITTLIENKPLPARNLKFKPTLIVRESCSRR